MDFGDSEPEDAWHPEDSIDEQLRNLVARLVLLDRSWIEPHDDSPEGRLEEIEERVTVVFNRGGISVRDQHRGNQILEDVELVRTKIGST